jgi:hypothetical protein
MIRANTLKQRTTLATAVALLIAFVASPFAYAAFEANEVSAVSVNDSVIVTLNVESGITITSPADTTMSQTIGVAADEATASTTWNVKTNNVSGYTIAVKASTAPAMQATATTTVPDYTPAVAATPETWSVGSGAAEFGFSAFGTRVSTGTWGTDTDCSGATTHEPSAGLKYRDFDTTDISIGSHTSTTTTAGDDTKVCYAVEQNGFYLPSGTYTATITATATTI